MVLMPVLHLLHRSPRRVLVVDALLVIVMVRALLAAVALPPHGAVAHAPVLVPVRGRPRVQPAMRERDMIRIAWRVVHFISDKGTRDS